MVADALQIRPDMRRSNGCTEIRLHTAEGAMLSQGQVTLAARIEDLYRTVTMQ